MLKSPEQLAPLHLHSIKRKNKRKAQRKFRDFEDGDIIDCKDTMGDWYESVILDVKDDKVLIIDDLIATGGTAEAAAKLIEMSEGKVAGYVFVINLFDLGGKDLLEKKGYKCFSLLDFPKMQLFTDVSLI